MPNISKIKTPDGTTYDISVAVDQTYNSTSTNPQSGIAVASAISNKQNTLVVGTNLDNMPTSGSNNPITSGGVYTVIGDINSVLESVL